MLSPAVENLVAQLTRLPGVGTRTAHRLAFHLLRVPKDEAQALAAAIGDVKERVRFCSECGNLTEEERCGICRDERRDRTLVCVVEQPADLVSLERTHEYRGLYHVLGGSLSPIDGVEPEHLRIDELMGRVERNGDPGGRPRDEPEHDRRGDRRVSRRPAPRTRPRDATRQRPARRRRPRVRRRSHAGPRAVRPTRDVMATTDYESLPALATEETATRAGTVVMKFGGTSVAGVERLRAVAQRLVAAREAGNRVVAVLSAMGDTTDDLVRLANEISPKPKARELDMLISVGERISCSLCAMAIHDLGHEAISLTGSQAGIVTDTVHGKAKIVDIRARRIHEALDAERIVLVAGFQGVSTDLDITTLGRGGSDTTAVALAAALGAEACEIYTDVDGVHTADPRVVPNARKLHAVSYEEMLEMAASGARVLQLRSVEFARNHDVKLHVRSSFSETEGTWIREEDKRMLEKALISGVTHSSAETIYRVEGVSAARLFQALADAPVNVDTVVQSGDEIVFSAPDRSETDAVLDGLDVQWSSRDDLGQVSIIGAGMRSHPGVAAKAFATLEQLGIKTELVSTSPIKIGFFVARDKVEEAVRALHEAFELDSSEAVRAHD